MNENESCPTIEERISFIRNFASASLPISTAPPEDKAEIMNRILRLLYNRICVAKDSLLCLIDNRHYIDAALIAGYIFETCAIISDIKDNDNEKQLDRLDQHAAWSMVGRLINLLEFDNTNISDGKIKEPFTELVETLEIYGESIVRDNPKKSHMELIKILRESDLSNIEKIHLIENTYKHPNPKSYVKSFYEKIYAQIKEQLNSDRDAFTSFYNTYCETKHSNMFSPEMDIGYNQEKMLGIIIPPMLWVFDYLTEFGIDKPMIPKS